LLRQLASAGIAVVHVTHRSEESAVADARLEMSDGREAAEHAQPFPADDAGSAAAAASTHLALSPKPTPRLHPVIRRPAPAAPSAPTTVAPASAPVRGAQLGPVGAKRGTRPLVSLNHVGYVYADRTPWAHRALEDVNLEFWRGDGVVLTGPNGSGKSTLAWLIAGLTIPTEGEALLESEPIVEQPGRVGIAFQHPRLQLLRPTVMADVMLGADEDRARRAMLAVDLDPDVMGSRRVDDLSGGEQRRVALAGLLVRQPDLIVLDEPYAGLDDEARRALAWTLSAQRRLSGVAVVVVTHDLDNADVLGERLIHLDGGRIVSEERLGPEP